MGLFEISIMVLAALFLAWFSYVDWKSYEVNAYLIIIFLALAFGVRLGFAVWTNDMSFLSTGIIGFVLFAVAGWLLTKFKGWHDGDGMVFAVMGMCLGPHLLYILGVVFFGIFYSLAWRFYFKNNEVAFVPVFFLALVFALI